MWRVYGGYIEGIGGYMEGMWRVYGGYVEGMWRVYGGYRRVCRGYM